jgi:hypothetical protein
MKGIAIRVLIVALIAGGAFLFRDRMSGSAGDLRVGDCFDDTPEATVESVQHHPCTEAHTAEAFHVGDFPGGDDAPLPTSAQLSTYADDTCFTELVEYMGGMTAAQSYPGIDKIQVGLFYPSDEDWKNGERRIVCYLYTVDGSQLTQSLKAAAQ